MLERTPSSNGCLLITLCISGEKAHSREFSEDAYRLAAEPKELLIVPGANHVDLYDRVQLIPFDKLTAFFRQHLGVIKSVNSDSLSGGARTQEVR